MVEIIVTRNCSVSAQRQTHKTGTDHRLRSDVVPSLDKPKAIRAIGIISIMMYGHTDAKHGKANLIIPVRTWVILKYVLVKNEKLTLSF